MTTDEQPVASSATPDSPVVGTTTPTLDRLTTEERQTWRKTGQLPDVKADSSPAMPDQAASTEASPSPASEPGPSKPKKNADSRKLELEAEIQALLTKRAQLRQEVEAPPQRHDAPAAPSPAPVGTKFPDFDKWAQTQPAESQSYEDYIDARAVHVFQQQQQAHAERQQQLAAQQDAATRLTQYRKAAETFQAEHPDYWDVVNPVTERPMPKGQAELFQDILTRSGVGPQLLYHLGTHPDVFDRMLSLPAAQAVYELGQLAGTLSAPAPPAIKTLSTAPEPPPSIRSKATTPVDDVDAAVKRGDFASYKLAMNRRSVARG